VVKPGLWNVALEAHNRNVLGDAATRFAQSSDRANRGNVIERKQGREGRVGREQLLRLGDIATVLG
jgi:hypothetical protein